MKLLLTALSATFLLTTPALAQSCGTFLGVSMCHQKTDNQGEPVKSDSHDAATIAAYSSDDSSDEKKEVVKSERKKKGGKKGRKGGKKRGKDRGRKISRISIGYDEPFEKTKQAH